MKHRNLWNDTLIDTLDPAFTERILLAMRQESRRVHARCRMVRGILTGVAVLFAIGFVIRQPVEEPSLSRTIRPSEPIALDVEVIQLDDTEFIQRLKEENIGIAIAGESEGRSILLVAHDGTIFRP